MRRRIAPPSVIGSRPNTLTLTIGRQGQPFDRWWPSKGAVVLEALDDSLATAVDFPDTGDLVEDLRTQMKGVTQLLGSTGVGRVYQGLIAAAQSDPDLSRAHIDLLWGAIYYRLLLHHKAAQARAQIDAALNIAFKGLR